MDIRLKQADISDHSWDFPDLVKKESFDSTLIDERCAQRVDRSFLCFRDVKLLQDRWNADGIQAQIRFFACFQGVGRYMYRNSFQDIKAHIDRNGEHLADASSQSCTPDTKLRKKAGTEKSTRCFSVFTLTKKTEMMSRLYAGEAP